MHRAARVLAALACAGGALACHETFCEWRTLRVPAEGADATRARVLFAIREEPHAEGNAAEWDRREREIRAYDRDWLQCHRALAGEPAPGSPLAACLARRPYTIEGPTAEAVARAECERELRSGVAQGAAFAACMADRAHRDLPEPRWPYERLGPRFAGAWLAETALFAERDVAGVALPKGFAVAGGLVAPAALLALALWIAVRGGAG